MQDSADYIADHPSPSGRYRVQTLAMEMRASLWAYQPAVFERGRRAPLMQIQGAWSAESVEWLSGEIVVLRLRRFPVGRAEYVLTADCARRTFTVGESPSRPFSEARAALDARADEHERRQGLAR